MKAPQLQKDDLMFMVELTDSSKESDFIIELFPDSSDKDSHGAPVKVIHNFDELIEFFEEEV